MSISSRSHCVTQPTHKWSDSHLISKCREISSIDGLMQKRRNSSALAMELRFFCINQLVYNTTGLLPSIKPLLLFQVWPTCAWQHDISVAVMEYELSVNPHVYEATRDLKTNKSRCVAISPRSFIYIYIYIYIYTFALISENVSFIYRYRVGAT